LGDKVVAYAPIHLSVFDCVEVNAVQSWACAKNKTSMPQLDFHKKLAQQMMENTIDMRVIPDLPPMHLWSRLRNADHALKN
jgi:hypothetical protein